MKRILAMILALVLCLGLCACGGSEEVVTKPSKEDIKDAIIHDTWVASLEEDGIVEEYTVKFLNNYEAKETSYYYYTDSGFSLSHTREGTYEITDDQIIISDSKNKVDIFIDYTYENGEISMIYIHLDKRIPLHKKTDE